MNTTFHPRTFPSRLGGSYALVILALCLFLTGRLHAANIQDVAPTAADAPVLLQVAGPGTNTFASFNGVAANRLVATVTNPGEVIFLGLSAEVNRVGQPLSNVSASSYRFQIRSINPNGTSGPVVHGPFFVNSSNANVTDYNNATYGTYPVTQTQGGQLIYQFQPATPGDYAIEFTDISNSDDRDPNLFIPFWDFTVAQGTTRIPGRVWSRSWAFRTPLISNDNPPECVWDRPFNGDLYSYTDDGFVSRIDFTDAGFQGLSFRIAFNSTGPGTTGDLGQDRMSIPGQNATLQAAEHRIFLVEPDPVAFPSGECGQLTAAETFRCDGPGEFCLDVSVTIPGQVEVLLDFNGNGQVDPIDVSLFYEFTANDTATCIPWDGLRGDGVPVSFIDTVDIVYSYSQGIQHWSAFDVEYMRNGFCVETIRPTCGGTISTTDLYWDDRDIPDDPGTGAPKDNRSGSDCIASPRSWNNFRLAPGDNCTSFDDNSTSGYGDRSTINTWWFANIRRAGEARVPIVAASISGPTRICEGDTAILTAQDASIVGTPTYFWEGPGVNGQTTQSVRVDSSGQYCVTVTAPNGCSSQTCLDVSVLDFDVEQYPGDLRICFGDSIQSPTAGDPSFDYQWFPTTGIDDPTSNQPTFFPTTTTVYTVRTTSTNLQGIQCETTEQVTVSVEDDIDLQVFGGGNICDPQTTISATTSGNETITLLDSDRNLIGTGNQFNLAVSGSTDYILLAENAFGCVDSLTFNVTGGPVDVTLPDTVQNCLSDGIVLSAQNLDANDVLSYDWTPANIFEPGTATTANPVFNADQGVYDVSVVITNQFGCSTTEELTIVAIDDSADLSFVPSVDCDGQTVSFQNTSSANFGFIYDFGDGNVSLESDPTHVYFAPGTYTVTLDLIFNQNCIASFTQDVTVFETTLVPDATISLSGCDNESASLDFRDNTFNALGSNLTYAWTFTGAATGTSTDANPSVAVQSSGDVTATLVVTTDEGCSESIDTTVSVDLNLINLSEEIIICPGESSELNPGADLGRTYTWTPAPDFDPNEPNPTTSVPGLYIVTVSTDAANFNCENVDTVELIIADSIGLVTNGPDGPLTGPGTGGGTIDLPTVRTCGDPIDISVDLTTNDQTSVMYTDINGNPLGDGSNITLSPDGTDTVIVVATNVFGCVERDTIVIINSQVDAGIDVGADGLNLCSAADTSATVVNLDPNDVLTYAWEANPIINGPLDGPTVDISAPDDGMVELMVTVTNQFGCDTMLTIPVSIIPFVPNEYPPVVAPCFAEGFTIDGGQPVDGYTYEWMSGANLDLTNPASPMGNWVDDETISVLITDPTTGCNSTQTIQVDVAPEISFMASPVDTALCEPGVLTISSETVNDNAVITWYDDADLTNEIGQGASFDFNAAELGQTYTIFGRALDPTSGCEQVVPVTVTVSELSVGLPLTDVDLCAGDAASIFGDGGPRDGFTYTYSPANNVDLGDPNNPVFVGETDESVEVTIVDDATGCSTTRTVNFNVTDIRNLIGTASPDTIILTGSSELSVEGCGDCGYEWFPPNGSLDPAGASMVTVTPDEAGDLTYEVDVTSNGCMETVRIQLRVEDPICEPENVFIPNAFTPNGDNVNDQARVRSRFADLLTEFEWIIYNRWGQPVYTSTDINESWDGTAEGDDLEPDVYGWWLRVVCPEGEELIQQGNITILR